MNYRVCLLVSLFLVVFSLGFVHAEGENAPTPAVAASAPVAVTLAADDMLSINGEKVTKADFYNMLENYKIPNSKSTVGTSIIREMIFEKTIMQLAAKANVSPTQEQIDAKIEIIRKQMGANFEPALASYGMTINDLKSRLKTEQAVTNLVTQGVTITDVMVKNEYNNSLKSSQSPFKTPASMKLGLIYSSDKAKIDKAYAELGSGKEFGSIAVKYSDDPAKKTSKGDMGWVSKGDRRIPNAVLDGAFKIAGGKIGKPVKADNKWYIAKNFETKPEVITPFDVVKDALKEQLAMKEGSKKNKLKELMDDFVKQSDIQVQGDAYKAVVEEIKQGAPVIDAPMN